MHQQCQGTFLLFQTDAHNYKIIGILTLNLLTTTIVAPPSNASKWQVGFNSAFKGLKQLKFRLSLRLVSVHAGTIIRELFRA